MREPRNPFRLRASEHIESDATFLRLFEPDVLELMPQEGLLDGVQIIRSASGGGKTSLFRIFSPGVLLTLHAQRKEDDRKVLYQRMRDFGAIGEQGPRLLGVMVSLARNYATLADMAFDPGRTERLLFSLLSARILLAALRGALLLRRLDYPSDLGRLCLLPAPDAEPPAGLELPCDGLAAYQWAKDLEAAVCDTIDSFGPSVGDSVPGSDTLTSLALLRPEGLTVDGEPVAERTLVMLDEVDRLTRQQRERLITTVVEMRSPVGVWIAERFEALSTTEMLSSGATQGRDYERVTVLEQYWRKRPKRFEKFVLNVADRRARAAVDVEIGSFSSCLQSSLEGAEWHERFEEALRIVAARVRNLAASSQRFREWVAAREVLEGTLRERAIAWRALEILIERERTRPQKELFDQAIPADRLEEKDDSPVSIAAERFLAREFGLPYYFGPVMLARLASSNVQQFIGLAADEFEEIVSTALLKKPLELSPVRQQNILRNAAQSLWDEIPRRVTNGREVRHFLEAVGRFCIWMTYKPTAPNDPAVNGIAISMADRDNLLNPQYLKHRPEQKRLAAVLASALAHNLLEPMLDYEVKGGRWMVLNLNRLLCVQFDLVLGYGLFKEKTLRELGQWVEHGFRPPSESSLL
jgi:hypothetical protein